MKRSCLLSLKTRCETGSRSLCRACKLAVEKDIRHHPQEAQCFERVRKDGKDVGSSSTAVPSVELEAKGTEHVNRRPCGAGYCGLRAREQLDSKPFSSAKSLLSRGAMGNCSCCDPESEFEEETAQVVHELQDFVECRDTVGGHVRFLEPKKNIKISARKKGREHFVGGNVILKLAAYNEQSFFDSMEDSSSFLESLEGLFFGL